MNINLEIGFRFLPPDEEIISYFLLNKVLGHHDRCTHIREVDLLKQEPWELPALSVVKSRYQEWLFFYKLNKISEQKTDRVTAKGFWKSTGQDRTVKDGDRVIGSKKTLVYYKGRTPHGAKTDWVMHEFRANASFLHPNVDNGYVIGFLRNKGAEKNENPTPHNVLPCTDLPASSSQSNAVAVMPTEEAPQLQQSNSMDYDLALALHTQMEDEGMFVDDLSQSLARGEFDLPSSSGIANYDQNRMEEEGGMSLDDLPPSNGEPNEWQRYFEFDSIEPEKAFMDSTFPPGLHEDSLQENLDPFSADFRQQLISDDISEIDSAPANEWYHDLGYMPAGTSHGHSKGFYHKRMQNGFCHDEILMMDSSVDSATLTTSGITCLESMQGERSVNSRACKSQYEPTRLKSVVHGPPKRVQLQGKSPGEAVSRDKTRESGVRGPVAELVRNRNSIVQSNKDPKMDSNLRSNRSAGSSRKNSFNFVEMSPVNCKRNPPSVYAANVVLGVILFMVIVWEVLFLG